MAFRAVICLALSATLAAAADETAQKTLRARGAATSFIRNLEFKQKLRVCNAYPYGSPLDVYVGRKKFTDEPLAYKSCGEFTPALKTGDKIDFKVEEASAGTFTISDLPSSDAVLLMVIFRHDTVSTAVSFESHVFASLMSAQVAVLDTYKGNAKSDLRIQDKGEKKNMRSELLRYDNVVAVNPGVYEVMLQSEGGDTKAKAELVAVPKESYVVMRCGVEAQVGTPYPQELMVFPRSDKRALGAAHTAKPTVLALLMAISLIFAAVSA